jgi:hypothetical protein
MTLILLNGAAARLGLNNGQRLWPTDVAESIQHTAYGTALIWPIDSLIGMIWPKAVVQDIPSGYPLPQRVTCASRAPCHTVTLCESQ